MNSIQELIPPRPFIPANSIAMPVYCSECEHFKQDIIGSKTGTCMNHSISDSNIPLDCKYHSNAHSIVSIFIFLKSGVSIYHKAIIKDFTKEIDPTLLTGFLQAVNIFGQELTNEEMSSIQFQKMNILFGRSKNINGALIIKGKIGDQAKEMFSLFLNKVEESFPSYFEGEFHGRYLPESEVDVIGFESMREYTKESLYPISSTLLKRKCKLISGSISHRFKKKKTL